MAAILFWLLASVLSTKAATVTSCPRVTCSNTEFANDVDDWCVKVNIDEQEPSRTTVSVRECLGEEKIYCEWGIPGFIEKFVWPFHPNNLVGEKLNLFQEKIPYVARCITSEQYYGRSELYPGWDCLLDMDCHSKKCVKGVCQGRLEGDTCSFHKDCASGLFCDPAPAPQVCKKIKSVGQVCDKDEMCGPGLFCYRNRCTPYFTVSDGNFPKDSRQCQSTLAKDDGQTGFRCYSVGYVKYGPYVNSVTNRVIYQELGNQFTLQCPNSGRQFDNGKECIYMTQNSQLQVERYRISGFSSPFFSPAYLLTGHADLNNCQCNSDQNKYCPAVANFDWKRLHIYYKDNIVPYIGNIHRDFYWRYDMWLKDPNSTLPVANLEYFTNIVVDIQNQFRRDTTEQECLKKISPFVQRKFANEKYDLKATYDEFPYYFYLQNGAFIVSAVAASTALSTLLIL